MYILFLGVVVNYSVLDIIATLLSTIIVAWIIIKHNILSKKFKDSKSFFYIALAMLFALIDILIHEFVESTPLPFADITSSFAHLAMLFLSVSALLAFYNETHNKKKKR